VKIHHHEALQIIHTEEKHNANMKGKKYNVSLYCSN
jgi:hypothetical protein